MVAFARSGLKKADFIIDPGWLCRFAPRNDWVLFRLWGKKVTKSFASTIKNPFASSSYIIAF